MVEVGESLPISVETERVASQAHLTRKHVSISDTKTADSHISHDISCQALFCGFQKVGDAIVLQSGTVSLSQVVKAEIDSA